MTQGINKTEVGAGATAASRLVLYPSDPHYSWESDEAIVRVLYEAGLIATRLDKTQPEIGYLCGDRFLSLITFLGCAPNIALAPQGDGREFCFVGLPPTVATPAAHFGVNAKPAQCRACKNPVRALSDVTEICCSHCGTPTLAWQLNWRRSACWARTVINVWNIYESEAVPSDTLLNYLANHSETPWRYCYIRS